MKNKLEKTKLEWLMGNNRVLLPSVEGTTGLPGLLTALIANRQDTCALPYTLEKGNIFFRREEMN